MMTPLHSYLKKRYSEEEETQWEVATTKDLKGDWSIPGEWDERLSMGQLIYGERYTYKLSSTPDPTTDFHSKVQQKEWSKENRYIDMKPAGSEQWQKMRRKSAQEIAGGHGAFFDARLYQGEIIKTSVAWFKLGSVKECPYCHEGHRNEDVPCPDCLSIKPLQEAVQL